jgi:hypothetical protein
MGSNLTVAVMFGVRVRQHLDARFCGAMPPNLVSSATGAWWRTKHSDVHAWLFNLVDKDGCRLLGPSCMVRTLPTGVVSAYSSPWSDVELSGPEFGRFGSLL